MTLFSVYFIFFFFSSRRRHTRCSRDWSSDVCSSDLYFLDQHGPNALYRNKGDGSFVDVTAQAAVALGDRISVGATLAHYENDGWPDPFVTSTRGRNPLFHNPGALPFEVVPVQVRLRHVGHS